MVVKNVTIADNNTKITLARDAVLGITLASNPSTGYTWNGVIPEQVTLLARKFQSDAPGLTGAGGAERVLLKFPLPGEFFVEYNHSRQWEKKTPLASFKITVVVA